MRSARQPPLGREPVSLGAGQTVEFHELAWRHNGHTRSKMFWEVCEAAGDQVFRDTGDSDFKEHFVVGVGKERGERKSRRDIRCRLDVVDQRRHGVLIELEPRPAKHLVVLR